MSSNNFLFLRCSLWQNLIYSAYPVYWGCANFQRATWLVLDPEPKDMCHCHPCHFVEVCEPQSTSPSGSIRYTIWRQRSMAKDRAITQKTWYQDWWALSIKGCPTFFTIIDSTRYVHICTKFCFYNYVSQRRNNSRNCSSKGTLVNTIELALSSCINSYYMSSVSRLVIPCMSSWHIQFM